MNMINSPYHVELYDKKKKKIKYNNNRISLFSLSRDIFVGHSLNILHNI